MKILPIIKLDNVDFRKRIKFPKNLSAKLAEEIGIHIGDGSLVVRRSQGHYDYYVCLNSEQKSYAKYVSKLFYDLYELKPLRKEYDNDENSLVLVFGSKLLVMWKLKLGLPSGPKDNISIPDFIVNSEFILDCIKGIFDTDFSITFKRKHKKKHYYPVIHLCSKSKKLIQQLSSILSDFGFSNFITFDYKSYDKRTRNTYIKHDLYLSGKDNLEKWMNIISSNNPIHITKYQIWKRFGFCPPKTTLKQRNLILRGELSPEKFYAGAGI